MWRTWNMKVKEAEQSIIFDYLMHISVSLVAFAENQKTSSGYSHLKSSHLSPKHDVHILLIGHSRYILRSHDTILFNQHNKETFTTRFNDCIYQIRSVISLKNIHELHYV